MLLLRHTQTVLLMCSLQYSVGTAYQLQMSSFEYSILLHTYNSNWASGFLIAFVRSFVYILFCKIKFDWFLNE